MAETIYRCKPSCDDELLAGLPTRRIKEVKDNIFAAVGSTLFLTSDFDVMTRASFLDRVITMQLDSK